MLGNMFPPCTTNDAFNTRARDTILTRQGMNRSAFRMSCTYSNDLVRSQFCLAMRLSMRASPGKQWGSSMNMNPSVPVHNVLNGPFRNTQVLGKVPQLDCKGHLTNIQYVSCRQTCMPMVFATSTGFWNLQPSFLQCILNIIFHRPEKQMARVYAGRIIAPMTDTHPGHIFTMMQYVG